MTRGEVEPTITAHYAIRQPVYFAEIPLEQLRLRRGDFAYKALSRHPALARDLSFTLPHTRRYTTIDAFFAQLSLPLLRGYSLIDTYRSKELGSARSYTMRLAWQAADRTLEEKQVKQLMTKVGKQLVQQLGASLRV